jgi:hypothetical protein
MSLVINGAPCSTAHPVDFATALLFADLHLDDHRLESGAANMFFAKGTILSWS